MLSAIAISADGSAVAFADETCAFSLWNWRQHHPETLPWQSAQRVRHLIFSDRHSLIAVSEKDVIEVWDIRENKTRSLLHHMCPIYGLESHPAGDSFLTVSNDMFVRIWPHTQAEQPYLLHHHAHVQKALFSPTGHSIITVGADFIVHIWEAATGRPLAELEHDAEVYRLALCADENYIATASRDQYVRIWRWTSNTLFEEARYHMTRNLTPEEWLQYFGDAPYEETFLLDWRADERMFDG